MTSLTCWETPRLTLTLVVLTFSSASSRMDYYPNTSPLKAFDVSGHLGESATLRCQLKTGKHNRGWFRMTWARIEPDGTSLPLVHLPVRDKIPGWGNQIHPSLQKRIKPLISVQPRQVELKIKLNNLTCEDESEYRCSVVTPHGELLSVAELSVSGKPLASAKPPIITEELHNHQTKKSSDHQQPHHNQHHNQRHHQQQHQHNHQHHQPQQHSPVTVSHKDKQDGDGKGRHFYLKCQGDVGLPPKDLVWYIKRPNDTYFLMIDKQRSAVDQLNGCHVIRTRTLSIHTAKTVLGTRYRCGYPGFITLEEMYDEFLIDERHVMEKIEIVKPKRKEDLMCQHGNCQMGRRSRDDNNKGDNLKPLQVVTIVISTWLIALSL